MCLVHSPMNTFLPCCAMFQAQPVPADLVAKMLGNRVAVSPIVTVEPRRRKFHKPITMTVPVPKASQKGMLNQYGGDAPTLRLLCSITGRWRSRLITSSSNPILVVRCLTCSYFRYSSRLLNVSFLRSTSIDLSFGAALLVVCDMSCLTCPA